MMRAAHVVLPLLASALLSADGADEPKAAPANTEVDLATAQPGRKPACTAAIAGQQWPDEAADPIFAKALTPYGYPMACTHAGNTYVWRSVKIDKPKKDADRASAR